MTARAEVDKIKVLVVDDCAVARHGLLSILRTQGDIEAVGEAQNSAQALNQAELFQPTIMLMDAKLANANDGEFIRRIKERMPNVKILCLTVQSREIEPALSAGADAYLMKDGERGVLLRALRRLALRG